MSEPRLSRNRWLNQRGYLTRVERRNRNQELYVDLCVRFMGQDGIARLALRVMERLARRKDAAGHFGGSHAAIRQALNALNYWTPPKERPRWPHRRQVDLFVEEIVRGIRRGRRR